MSSYSLLEGNVAGKKKELLMRILMGVILIPIAIYLTLFSHDYLFFAVLLLITLLATREFIPLVKKENIFLPIPLMWVSGIAIPFSLIIGDQKVFLCIIFILLFILFLFKMFSNNPVERVIEDISYSFFAIIFLPFLFSFIVLVREVNTMWLMFLFFVIWASDTFAYFTGITLGKHKLIPKVSPKKSYEGLIGGIIGALIVAFIFNYYFFHLSILKIFIIAIDVIVAGVIGDLIESMIKRSANVKDSGNIIPGHGGILDRFDSILFAAPVLYFYLYFLVGING